ncbi:uncharacterized protein LOC106771159 isoform X2 [Vigna radiata var. radiata]|uniref:Uncharacterized protein LOC106771159 isoform X2 n=1 Tax=Vigna radiata var. radiata TaxID=3916 RepID=A0A1S3V2J7_VIGRR|nr:uncharacterized protein LOC106771159 isoform X2 [Vigna radiata var. radiata]
MATLMATVPRMVYSAHKRFVNNRVSLPRNFAMATDSAGRERAFKGTFDYDTTKYGSRATRHDFDIYAANASFEDPLMCARGVKQIKSAFYSLPKLFKESKIVEYSVKEYMVSPGNGEILIDNKQYYNFLGRNINMVSLIKLYLEEGKIVRHEDWWDRKPITNRETAKVPFLGRIAEMTRRGSMFATHVLMRFGKDPSV